MGASRIAKLSRLGTGELWELGLAQLELLRAQLRVWRAPSGVLLGASAAAPPGAPPEDAELPEAVRRIELAVGRAAECGVFRPACLVRALALERRLRARGHEGARICVGVSQERGEFSAHAWVEYRGVVLDQPSGALRDYSRLSDLRVRG